MLARLREEPGRGWRRHLSITSLSFARVLVMSENSRTRSPKAAETPLAAASRTARSVSESLFSAAETESSSPATVMVMLAIVSSNRRFQAARPVTSFSCSSFSISSGSWCGSQTRRSRSQGRQPARAADSASRASSVASGMRFSSSVKNTRCEEMPVTRSLIVCWKRPEAGSCASEAKRSWA